MFRTHDNWERLVAAVIRREELWQLCHQSSFVSSVSSSSSFSSIPSFPDTSFDFELSQSRSFRSLEPDIVFFEGASVKFSLEEFLMASPYVIGEETSTSTRTFVVCLRKDIKVVVKISKVGNFAPEQLEKWIQTIGSIHNKNVVKPWGYYLSHQNEMLCFYEYFPQGSVHELLHRKSGVVMDWVARYQIANDTAKGLAHMHEQSDGKFVHGNMKSSNIFANSKEYVCCLGDPPSVSFKISEYHPPEVSTSKKASQSQESDVYSFGVLLIELVSVKSPTNSVHKFKTYVDWARNCYIDKWTVLEFDQFEWDELIEMKEMYDMLQIAYCCVRNKPEQRPGMNIVVEMLHMLRSEAPLRFFRRYAEWIDFRAHDNWEMFVAAVIRREELWQLCPQHSRTSSLVSISSDFTPSSFADAYFFDYDHKIHSSKHHMTLSFQDLIGTKIDLSQEGKETKLVFFKDSRVEFGLEELLTSSTYVLGEKIDSFSRTFVVCLRNDIIEKIVVKRFEIGNVARDQLEKRIEIIGSINNDNVAKLWGYYLCDSGNRVILDSETRFKIAINVAKGLAHVHELCDGKFVHGNINASNIFINSQEYQCCLGDLGTVNFQITGYNSPEFSSRKKASQASDIYCFGVFLIELVSDRSPTLSSCKFKSYVDWARYHYRDEWTVLVYDIEILKKLSEKKRMFDMLQIAMHCLREKSEDRPNMNHVVDMLCCSI
ncbi:hypothetical protein RD792_003084 [Penstemon davidsonii]|uniref:Protein kinase domain-containing protein n=1 Tax=Penstemon davidsonii TaxID=160366 RepID=A0ABR0DTV8_9LAMI|nr:hypothetical protein RD792_003084 [Penstemon davidsonii]